MSKKQGAASSWRSIVVLAASLVLVYTIFFWYEQPIQPLIQKAITVSAENFEPAPRAEEEELMAQSAPEQPAPSNDTEEVEIAQVQIAEDNKDAIAVGGDQNTSQDADQEQQGQITVAGKQFFSFQELFDQPAAVTAPDRVPLANTFERIGTLRSIADYGLEDEVEYVLKTVDNTHYVYLGQKQSVTIPNILQMGWSVVAIEGKNAINQHSLFGDRVLVLNSPQYDETYQKVIFIVFFAQTGDAWFVQVDSDYYEANAEIVRATFDERYDR